MRYNTQVNALNRQVDVFFEGFVGSGATFVLNRTNANVQASIASLPVIGLISYLGGALFFQIGLVNDVLSKHIHHWYQQIGLQC